MSKFDMPQTYAQRHNIPPFRAKRLRFVRTNVRETLLDCEDRGWLEANDATAMQGIFTRLLCFLESDRGEAAITRFIETEYRRQERRRLEANGNGASLGGNGLEDRREPEQE